METTAFRAEVRSLVADLVPPGWTGIGVLPEDEAVTFRARAGAAAAERGWVAPMWPAEYSGAGLGPAALIVLVEELTGAGTPFGSDNDAFGISMLGNTMLRWSAPELLRRFLPRIVSGEYVFAHGFSEPEPGPTWRRSRCAPSATVRSGCSTSRSSGRPLRTSRTVCSSSRGRIGTCPRTAGSRCCSSRSTSRASTSGRSATSRARPAFKEVLGDRARTGAGLVVGEVDRGWAVAMTLLGFERGETAIHAPIRFRNELDRLVVLVRERGLDTDPDVRRHRPGRAPPDRLVLRCHGRRTAAALLAGGEPGPEAAPFKLLWSEYHRVVTELALDVLGLDALAPTGRRSANWYQTDDPGAANSVASWTSVYLNARAGTIYAGSSQVQRNIVAELLLGLPKEPRLTA